MRRRLLWGALAALAMAGCDLGPKGGELVVSLSGAGSARALVIRVAGPLSDATPAMTGYRVLVATLPGDTSRIAVIAPAGTVLAPGPVVRIRVPDVDKVARYSATTIQAAGPSYALLVASGFLLTVAAP